MKNAEKDLAAPAAILHSALLLPCTMILGIEIGGTKLQLVLGDEAGRISERRKLAVDPAGGAAGIRQQIEQTLPELLRGRQIPRVGVGFGGPVDWKTGRICRSHQIEGWSEFDLGGWLRPTGRGAGGGG